MGLTLPPREPLMWEETFPSTQSSILYWIKAWWAPPASVGYQLIKSPHSNLSLDSVFSVAFTLTTPHRKDQLDFLIGTQSVCGRHRCLSIFFFFWIDIIRWWVHYDSANEKWAAIDGERVNAAGNKNSLKFLPAVIDIWNCTQGEHACNYFWSRRTSLKTHHYYLRGMKGFNCGKLKRGEKKKTSLLCCTGASHQYLLRETADACSSAGGRAPLCGGAGRKQHRAWRHFSTVNTFVINRKTFKFVLQSTHSKPAVLLRVEKWVTAWIPGESPGVQVQQEKLLNTSFNSKERLSMIHFYNNKCSINLRD